tara:strand:+ start:17004 stop:18296 length:1293 start_codon:yes stop_codon:yes gene_type:complete
MSGIDNLNSEYNYGEFLQDEKIHSSVYTDQRVYEDEMDRIFRAGWVFVCHDSEILNAGDYVRRRLGNDEVFAIRGRDGEVSVIENRCAHRGNLMCVEEKGTKKALVCQYHGWAYDTKGTLIDVPYSGGTAKETSCLNLKRLPKVDSYNGFIFASFNDSVPPLLEHLGRSTELIDRAVGMSPVGKIDLSGGWVKHQLECNWKMLPESDTDGYHVGFVHKSLAQVIRSNYDSAALEEEEDLKSVTRDWGGGHVELDFSPAYTKPLEWFGCKEDRYPSYVKSMLEAYGDELGNKKLIDGPPHSVIFPNLFLGEMTVIIFQPVSSTVCLHLHTPLMLKGVDDDVNRRILRQSDGGVGPCGLFLADDSVIAERAQVAIQGKGGWLDLSRGVDREIKNEDGVLEGHLTDETSNRGFWQHYKTVMTQAPSKIDNVAE